MPPRANWKGHLKLSLVAIPVRVFNATSSAERISLNQLHKGCNSRLRQQMVCPIHGNVGREDIVKGYEYEKDRYVIIDPEEIEKIQVATTKAIEITQFVDPGELDPMLLDAPYYVAPDGPVAEEAFRVVREAIRKSGLVGIGRYVIGGREHQVAIQVKDRGLLMTTLRAASEVRNAAPYFEEIRNGEVDKGQLKLAADLIRNMSSSLDTAEITDRYQTALLGVVKAKIAGTAPSIVEAVEVDRTFNFMDALKASIEGAAPKAAAAKKAKKPPAKSVEPAAKKKRKKA